MEVVVKDSSKRDVILVNPSVADNNLNVWPTENKEMLFESDILIKWLIAKWMGAPANAWTNRMERKQPVSVMVGQVNLLKKFLVVVDLNFF